MFLSVIIPAYNEEKRLPETLKKVRDYLQKQEYEYEVIVVDDGSSDQTKNIVNNIVSPLSGGWKDLQILSYQPNKGKGYAVKMGMLAAKGDWRLLMDADNSTDLSQIEKLLPFKNKFDVIIGSRYLNKDSIKIKQPLMRRMVSRFGNLLIRITLGIKSVDTQCGFKLFSSKATGEIFPKQMIDRWGFDMEILAIAIRKGYKIKEVAVDWYDAVGSQVKNSAAVKTLKELWQIKRNIWAKKY